MSGRSGAPARRRGTGISVAGVLGRLRTDAGPLVGVTLVVALAAGVATAVPRLVARTADDAVQYAVATAGDAAEVTAIRPIQESPWDARYLDPELPSTIAQAADEVEAALSPALADVLGDPVTSVTTSALTPMTPLGEGLYQMNLYYLGRHGPEVEWLDGGPAPETVTARQAERWADEEPWPVAGALSADVAADLGVGVGDRVSFRNENRSTFLDLVVSGIFRPKDPSARAWVGTGGLLSPRAVGSALTGRVLVGALLSDDSLPVAVRAMPAGTSFSTVTLAPEPTAFTSPALPTLIAEIAGLKTQAAQDAAQAGYYGTSNRIQTDLDAVLRTAQGRERAGTAQAWLLLAGVLATLGLSLLLAARLLLGRRAAALLTYRARGATGLGLSVELGLESAVVAALGTALGVGLVSVWVPGPMPWAWLLPVTCLAAVAPPALAVSLVVRRTGGGRPAANRLDRRVLARDRTAARVVLEAAVVLAAVGAVAALRARRVGSDGPDALMALTPTLVGIAAAVLLAHLVPVWIRWTLRGARRSRHTVGLLAAARAHSTGTALLPFAGLAVAVALAGLASTVAATIVQGRLDASWTAVGADVVAVADPDPSLLDVAADLDALPDVTAVAGVIDEGQLFGRWGSPLVRIVAVSAQQFADLLEATPLPGAPELRELAADGSDVVPVLLSAGFEGGTGSLSVLWEDVSVDVRPVGVAPGIFGDTDTVVFDAEAFGAVSGTVPAPDRLWLVGPGAEQAVEGSPALADADVRTRSGWLATQEEDPLGVALLRLAWAVTGGLWALCALVIVLAAATTARQRAGTLAMLRTLGLDRRAQRRVTAGEMFPGVATAVLGGLGSAVLLAWLVVLPLGLGLVTSQQGDPRLVVPAWVGAPAAVALVTVGVLVWLESLARRRERLGTVLRVGGP